MNIYFEGVKIYDPFNTKKIYTYSEFSGLLLFNKHPTNSLWLIVLVLSMKECKKIACFADSSVFNPNIFT